MTHPDGSQTDLVVDVTPVQGPGAYDLPASEDRGSSGRGLPETVRFFEEFTGDLDLSDLNLGGLGSWRTTATLTIEAQTGVLGASRDRDIAIGGAETTRLTLTGELRDLRSYLRDDDALSYTGAPDLFGVGADRLRLTIATPDRTVSLGAIQVDLRDMADDRTGGAGADTLTGDAGIDILNGMDGNDSLSGRGGADVILGGDGNDTISGGPGGDALLGGSGNDVLYYFHSAGGVSIDLERGFLGFQSASGGDAEGDVISGFEHVYGSNFADTILGNEDRNILFGYDGDDLIRGLSGDDVIRGDAGADTLDGGDGQDWVRYLKSPEGVQVSLAPGETGIGGDAEGDVLSGFEHIQGSDHGDVLTGDAAGNYLMGYDGDDWIVAGEGDDSVRGGSGADTLEGGAGIDRLQYFDSAAGVEIDLRADGSGLQSASGGDAQGDVISGFENVFASDHADRLIGNDVRNYLYGRGGDDSISGGGGKDVLRGDAGADRFIFDAALAASNVDRVLDFDPGVDMLVLESTVFNILGTGGLAPAMFHASMSGEATTSAHRILYEIDTGLLSYDSDGSGAAEAVAFAQLSDRPILSATDFTIELL